jgi:phospholipid transport system substrate-binding protein
MMSPSLTRRLVLAGIVGVGVAMRAQVVRAAAADPVGLIGGFNDGLLQIMRAGSATPFAQRYATFTPVLEHSFNLPLILRNAVGLRWPSLPSEQQERLQKLFEAFTTASYVANFDSYNGQKFAVLPDTRSAGADQVVQSRITRANGEVVKIDYVVGKAGDSWRVIDVLLDGTVSRVAVLRSDFRSLVTPSDASKLIDSLRQKVADLSGGTISA